MRTLHRVLVVGFALLLTLAAVPTGVAPAVAQDAETFFVPETEQLIAEPFLSAWTDLGGADRLGMPVSSVDEPGAGASQFFERGVLRLSDDEAVEMLPAGRALLDRPDPSLPLRTGRRAPSAQLARAFTPLASEPSGNAVAYDAETGHAIKGGMLTAYEAAGGAEMLGAPISEAHQRGDGRVQWFERGRLESRDGEERTGPVGVELALLTGVDLTPKSQGSYATIDLTGPVVADGGPIAGGPIAGASFSPARISIPAIGVDAYIESIGIDGGVMGTPSNPWNVGWYSGLGGPGGNTVMAGHKDWASIGPVVFFSLGALGPGSEIYLYDGAGNAATYVVYSAYTVDAYADSGSIINQGGDTLTLITCGGDFSGGMYNLRVIVHASRAG